MDQTLYLETYGLSLIHHAILRAGLSSYFSFLHSHQPNRANLVYDLMEPFRPWAVDRVILGMFSKGPEPKIDKNGMAPETRRELISRLEKRWEKDGSLWKRNIAFRQRPPTNCR